MDLSECSLNACFICFMLSDYSLNACSMLSECSWSELQTDYIMDSIILIIKLASTTFSDLEDPPQLCSVNSSWRLSRLINQWELPAQPADQWAQRRQISFWCSHGRAEQVTLSPLASLLLHFLPNIAREERGARIGGSKGGGGWLMITTLWGIRPLPCPAQPSLAHRQYWAEGKSSWTNFVSSIQVEKKHWLVAFTINEIMSSFLLSWFLWHPTLVSPAQQAREEEGDSFWQLMGLVILSPPPALAAHHAGTINANYLIIWNLKIFWLAHGETFIVCLQKLFFF